MAFEEDWLSRALDRSILLSVCFMWFGFTGMWYVIADINSQFAKTEPPKVTGIIQLQWKIVTLQDLDEDENQ